MADVYVVLDPVALEWLLNSPDGPVGVMTLELGAQATAAAKALAPTMKRRNQSQWGKVYDPRYQYGPAGMTKSSVHLHGPAYNRFGEIYASANAAYGPTLFLERPAEQIHSAAYKFLSGALDTVTI